VPQYFEFEVSLCHVKPKIWRRFLLPADSTFQDLHMAIQDAGGWSNYHLFAFHHPESSDVLIAGIPSDEDLDVYGKRTPDARRIKLSSFFGKGKETSCMYEYDFGDGWEHDVSLSREVSLPESFKRRLLGGERAFPHEDCGGYGGYQRCVEVVRTGQDPDGDDPEEFMEWLGGWEPDFFDLEATKAAFDRPRAGKKSGGRKGEKQAPRQEEGDDMECEEALEEPPDRSARKARATGESKRTSGGGAEASAGTFPGSAFRIALAESDTEIERCHSIMGDLRPHVRRQEFLERVKRQKREGGYELAFLEVDGEVKAVAGFRISECLAWGKFLYVDDLVSAPRERSKGHGGRLLDWLVNRAREEGCDELHLDSGVQRFDAHRFYLENRMSITGHHFSMNLRKS